MTGSKASTPSRLPRWAWALLLVLVCAMLGERALHMVHRNARLWSELRAFTVAFGGIIGVALLLAAGLALLFLLDALLFREEATRTRDSDGA
jgi:hypothetical protein